MTTTRALSFDEATAVAEVAPGRFTASLHEDWTLAGRAHGGLMLALAARAAAAFAGRPHVISATGTFLFAPGPGPVVIEAGLLRAGRSLTQVDARILQEGEPCLHATAILGEIADRTEPYWTSAAAPVSGTEAYESSIRLPPINPFGRPIPLWDQVDLRIEPGTYGYAQGEPTDRGELRGWLTLPGGATFDPFSLLLALDVLPPATFDIDLSASWVPTLSLTAYLRALPAPGPIRLTQAAGIIEGGRVDETCYAWDSAGHLVGQCTQLAGVRLG